MNKNVFRWLGHAKKIYDGIESSKRGRSRPWMTFENTILKLYESLEKNAWQPKGGLKGGRDVEFHDSERGERDLQRS